MVVTFVTFVGKVTIFGIVHSVTTRYIRHSDDVPEGNLKESTLRRYQCTRSAKALHFFS
jgi:hypothetical protein